MSWQLFCGFHIPTSDPACRFLWGLQLSPHRLKLPPVWWTPYQCRLYEFLFVQLHSLAYINQFLCTWIFLGDENPSNESRNVTSNSSLDERMQFHLSGSFLGRHRRCSFSASPSPGVEDINISVSPFNSGMAAMLKTTFHAEQHLLEIIEYFSCRLSVYVLNGIGIIYNWCCSGRPCNRVMHFIDVEQEVTSVHSCV